jgi:apolipoprotein N-acyltransferase
MTATRPRRQNKRLSFFDLTSRGANATVRCMVLSNRIAFLPSRLQAATGWRRAGLAILFGAVMALSMPPFDLFPLLWICLPAALLLLRGAKNLRQAFAVGWCFSFGFLVCSLYWIAASMLVDFHTFWWAIPLSVAGLPAAFALYYGIATTIAWRLGAKGVGGAVTFGLMWFLADYARGHLFTGFPWNLLGYAWSGVLPMLQVTSVIGIHGLTLLTAVAASLPAALAEPARPRTARRVNEAAIAAMLLLAMGGGIRLILTHTDNFPDVRLRLVQPDIDQARKWLVAERQADFERTLNLTSAPPKDGGAAPTHYIWPETASTYYLSEDTEHREEIGRHIPAASAVITGVIRRDLDKNGNTRFYNSLVAVDGLGRLVAGYDKVHLVPFGEYVPLRKYIPIKAIAAEIGDFTPGDGVRSLRVLGLPVFSPLVCYEAIFPGAVTDPTDRPDFMINITNDAWYGQTIGPYQHFAIVRIRAIEEGMALVRAANTGISGVVDPAGRIRARIGLGQRGFIDSDLPQPLPQTLFEKWGEVPLWLLFMSFALAVIARRNKKQ